MNVSKQQESEQPKCAKHFVRLLMNGICPLCEKEMDILIMPTINETPATPSADEEIDRIAKKYSEGLLHIGSGVVKWRINQALKEYAVSHANEREERRTEQCCECNVYVSEWVEAEHRNGRICRPCEELASLRATLAAHREFIREMSEFVANTYDNADWYCKARKLLNEPK